MKSRTKGILAVVFGALSILILPPVVFGVLEIYLGNKARKRDYPKLGMTGIFLGVLSLILMILYLFYSPFNVLQKIQQTDYPLIVIVSESMGHGLDDGRLCGNYYKDYTESLDNYWKTCGNWYEEHGILKEEFKFFPFPNGFNKGDLLIVEGAESDEINVGEVIVFIADRPQPIPHRVVNKLEVDGKIYYQTKGDHNGGTLGAENKISEDQILGKITFRIPYLGWVKIIFVQLTS